MVECADHSLKAKDAALNRIYKLIYHQFDDDALKRRLFIEAERKWIKKRDSTCKDVVEGEDVINRTAVFVLLTCKADETDKRIKQLQALRTSKNLN